MRNNFDYEERYVLVGPEDHNQLLTFWSLEKDEWVEFEDATKFDFRILMAPHPQGTQYIIDTKNYTVLTPIMGREV